MLRNVAAVAFGLSLCGAAPSIADDWDDVATWMLVLKTRDGAIAIAPTTYDKADECNAATEAIAKAPGFLFDARCYPASMSDASIASFTAKREAEDAEFEQLMQDLPALKAEREAIKAVPVEKRTKVQMDRLTEIDRRLSRIIE